MAGTRYHYRVHEYSGQIPIDTVVSVAPTDTVILSLPAATYVVDLDGVPSQCRVRDGLERLVLIAANTNTTALRYFVVCQPQLLLSVFVDGPDSGQPFVYHVEDAAGQQRLGLIRANDTLEFEGLATGEATVDLGNVPDRCITVNNGGNARRVSIDSVGGVEVDFLVRCADPIHRPHIESLHATYHDGALGIVFHASDPDRDIERYIWDLTDYRRTSLLPNGSSTRSGLGGGRTANFDTMTVLATFEIGLPDSAVTGKCAALWLADTQGNPSEVVEVPLGAGGRAPGASVFNAHFLGTDVLRTDLTATDPDGDFVGVFVQVRLRDGTLGIPDGNEDIAYFNTVGYLGDAVPDVPLGSGRLPYDAFYAEIGYLMDARGNFTRIEDADLFH